MNAKILKLTGDNDRLNNLCGHLDEHIRLIEKHYLVTIANRGGMFNISGDDDAVATSAEVLQYLYNETQNKLLSPEDVYLAITEFNRLENPVNEIIPRSIQTKRGLIHGRGGNQKQYLQNISTHDINFGIGPAGTGKSFLAVAAAIDALDKDYIRRIILVRPAVEAGERLGFLPGDLTEKIDPYLRPLYDALYEMLGVDLVHKLIEKHVIEIAPLAFMRGRTLNEAFIILDEAQNTTIEQMKMFLTRIGIGSTAVITGDTSQIDLPRHIPSGLMHAISTLEDVEGISISRFTSNDVVRHPIVAKIINAYEAAELKEKEKRGIVNRPSK